MTRPVRAVHTVPGPAFGLPSLWISLLYVYTTGSQEHVTDTTSMTTSMMIHVVRWEEVVFPSAPFGTAVQRGVRLWLASLTEYVCRSTQFGCLLASSSSFCSFLRNHNQPTSWTPNVSTHTYHTYLYHTAHRPVKLCNLNVHMYVRSMLIGAKNQARTLGCCNQTSREGWLLLQSIKTSAEILNSSCIAVANKFPPSTAAVYARTAGQSTAVPRTAI